MIDLERLIRAKQDELRGRPLNWFDHFREWLETVDWWTMVIVLSAIIWGIAYSFAKIAEYNLRYEL